MPPTRRPHVLVARQPVPQRQARANRPAQAADLSPTANGPRFDIQYARRAHGAATANETIDSGPVRHNLPAHRVHLIGRKHDLALARTELSETEGGRRGRTTLSRRTS